MNDELTIDERRALDAWSPLAPPASFADRVLAARDQPAPRPRRRMIAASVGLAVAAAAVAVVVATRPRAKPTAAEPTLAVAPPAPPPSIDAGVTKSVATPPRELPPTSADLRVSAGDGGTIHDSRGRVAVEIAFPGWCPDDALVEVSPGARKPPLPLLRGRDAVTVELDAGHWAYAVYCDMARAPVAEADLVIVRDAGDRPLPAPPSTNTIDADGRVYRISYAQRIPTLRVRSQRTNEPRYRLWVTAGSDVQTYGAQGPIFSVPAFSLREGTYQLRTSEAPDATFTTVIIERDWQAPQVALRSPKVDEVWRGEIFVEGTALPGWKPSVDGVDLPLQSDGTFAARLMIRPGAKVLALKLVNQARNTTIYYLRRPGR